jgi:hypothetical protein
MIYKILHRKLKIELHEPHLKRELRPSKWKAVQAPLLAYELKLKCMLFLNCFASDYPFDIFKVFLKGSYCPVYL